VATRICNKCGAEKPLSGFYKAKSNIGGLTRGCKECCKKQVDTYRRSHTEMIKEKHMRRREKHHREREKNRYKSKYGITLEQYDYMLEVQKGQCLVCGGINADGKKLSVDHDHVTGRVRGLLCSGCNLALGNVKESVSTLLGLARYLYGHGRKKDSHG
jgi:hypothetical protein